MRTRTRPQPNRRGRAASAMHLVALVVALIGLLTVAAALSSGSNPWPAAIAVLLGISANRIAARYLRRYGA